MDPSVIDVNLERILERERKMRDRGRTGQSVPRSVLLKLSRPKELSDAHQNAELRVPFALSSMQLGGQVPGPCKVDMVKFSSKILQEWISINRK